MPSTLKMLRDDLRERLHEPDPRQYRDTWLNKIINEGAKDLCRRTECHRATWTADTLDLVQSYTGPADIVRVHRLEFIQSDDTTIPLEYRDFNSMDQVWHTRQTTTTGTPLVYTTWGMPPTLKLVLFPTPEPTGTIKLYYYRLPALALSDATVIEVPEGWEDAVVAYAESRALRRDGDQRWTEAKQLYDEMLSDLLVTSTTYNDQPGQIDSWTNFGLPSWLTDGY